MQTLQADVIVIAGGAAGLCAAIAAAQGGASVLVFEKEAITGGTANRGMGPLGIESRHTRLRQFQPTKDKAFEVFMDYTHWRVDAQLVRAYLNKSGDTIHWLEALGVEFLEPASYFPSAYPTWHLVKPPSGVAGPGAAGTMTGILAEQARALGVQILLETPVRRIVKDGERVVGVLAQNKDGEDIEAHAAAVIIATGGFGNSPAMVQEYAGYTLGQDMFPFRIPGITGDGIRMAWEAGAAATEMSMEMIYGMPDNLSIPPPLHEACRQPHLFVNLLGERFVNEAIMPNVTFTANALARQKDRTGLLIFDSAILAQMAVDFDFRNRVFPVTKLDNPEAAIAGLLAKDYPHFFVADSLEDLAAQTGIDPAGLRDTVAVYNASCARGYDELFNKDHAYLRPIEGPKYYAARHYPSAYGSTGGIKINHKTEVIGTDWRPIPGLFAAGTDACAIYGDSYVFIMPGNSMGFAVNTGRIAGENALKLVAARAPEEAAVSA
ncbi:FAD-dependent oxidoreductase [Hymenobacter caeli]|uniref:Fumarate reductase flavoprotein subunit n=1 Tax=Hymenobacter caeli TaxID=2735894 RepID=A0ABX2FUG3_9BACT|nr:FAD-dependent oxidoreductase [Hymenobacter caeli]NRT20821.1 fumarate reductase flavoprotein subunit [Hymenobacter caeli]